MFATHTDLFVIVVLTTTMLAAAVAHGYTMRTTDKPRGATKWEQRPELTDLDAKDNFQRRQEYEAKARRLP